MTLAFVRDPGLRVLDFIQAAQALDAVPADAFAAYGLDASAVTRVREKFADWPGVVPLAPRRHVERPARRRPTARASAARRVPSPMPHLAR